MVSALDSGSSGPGSSPDAPLTALSFKMGLMLLIQCVFSLYAP